STGTHTVSETQSNGYTASYSGACDSNGTVVLNSGDDKTCIITNDDIAPKLTIIKEVNNDNGGKMKVEDFPLYVNNELVVSGVKNIYKVGQYIVSEDGDNGYSATFSGACDSDGKVTLNPGDDKTCVITNDDISPELTVIKKVVNDDGGDLQPSDFTMQVSGTDVSKVSFEGSDFPGVTVTLDAGNYSVDEINHDGYSKSLGTDCSGTISVGEKKTCIITNDDISPRLIVKKHVINDNGGNLHASDFTLNITGTNVSSHTVIGSETGVEVFLNAGSYSVDENNVYGYAKMIGDNCSGTITIGETKECTITNNDIQPTLKVTKLIKNTYEGTLLVTDVTLLVKSEKVESGIVNYFN
ncbi:MAG: hypothetical protein ACK4ON_14260, partial [Bacteroidia bacterium]